VFLLLPTGWRGEKEDGGKRGQYSLSKATGREGNFWI
jgi:hypothetical protein